MMDPQVGLTWTVVRSSDEALAGEKAVDVTFSFTERQTYPGPSSQFWQTLTMSKSWFFQGSAVFLILCLLSCSIYFALVRRRRPMQKVEPAEDPTKAAEAKMNAALAAQRRQEAFDKSGAEEEARKAAAELAARKKADFTKPWKRNRGGDSSLKWRVGASLRR